MQEYTKDFLGRGWAYPVTVNKATGRVKLSEYEADIAEAIKIILTTRRGERIMRPEFGSRLHEYVFEVDSLGVRSRIEHEAEEALNLWEPRIKDIQTKAEFSEGRNSGFVLNISYVVRNTNSTFNVVYPFFITEGGA